MNHVHSSVPEPIQGLFAAHGLRCTRQRKALYEALAATHAHPTADQLYQQVVKEEGDISLATVYNTLEAFCRAGLAQKLVGKGGSARYDATVSNHLHVRDQSTGTVADVPEDLSREVLKHIPAAVMQQLESKLGFKIQQVQIELVGRFEGEKSAVV
jgi:Fe2+ or Zn2+ uptake regulation protein